MPDSKLAATFERLATELEAGHSLEEALAADSRFVPPHLRQLISAGAKSGKLADVLVRFVEVDRSWIELGRGIRLALAYPIVLLSLLALLAVTLELLIVPNFAKIYGDFRASLPYPTKAMVWLSGRRMIELVAIVAAALVIMPLLARFLLPAAFRRRLVMRIPLFGPVVRWRGVTLWARLMELLLNEGTRVPEALQLAAGGVNDANLAAESMRLSRSTASGQKLGDAIAMSRRIPASLVPIVRWGEDTGSWRKHFARRATCAKTGPNRGRRCCSRRCRRLCS